VSVAIAVILYSIFLFYKKEIYALVFILSNVTLGAIAVTLIKNLLQRPRPVEIEVVESSYSFPSAHSLQAAIITLSLYFIYKNRVKSKLFLVVALLLWAFVMAFSRLYLNAHYFSDVVGGLVFGAMIVLTNSLIYRDLR